MDFQISNPTETSMFVKAGGQTQLIAGRGLLVVDGATLAELDAIRDAGLVVSQLQTPEDAGTINSGTFYPEAKTSSYQKIVNNGAFTLRPPRRNESPRMILEITNGAAAGAITFTGWTRVSKPVMVTTAAKKYICVIETIATYSSIEVIEADVANAPRGGNGEAAVLLIPVGDETTAITTGTSKVTFRVPFAMTLKEIRASLTTASSSGLVTVDVNVGGSTILSTKLSIDASEKTSATAATAAVLTATSLAQDAEVTIDIDAAGTNAAGLKLYFVGAYA